MKKSPAICGMWLLCAAGLTLGPPALGAPPPSSERTPAAVLGTESADTTALPVQPRTSDPASVSLFVRQIRTEAETGPALPPRTLQDAIGRLVPDLEGFPRCLDPVLSELERQMAESQPLSVYSGAALSAPVLPREATFASRDGHFLIHYTLDRTGGHGVIARDRDSNGAPDYVDQIAAALEAARQKLVVRLGYRNPQIDAPLDVFLANLGGRIDGYTLSGSPSSRGPVIVIDSRLLGNDSLLRAAVAHQYAHAVLAGYSADAPSWWTEASAAWIEGLVVGSYAHYTDQLQAALESAATGLGYDDARLMQGRLLWPAYLSSLDPHGTLVRSVWENLERAGSSADIWDATEETLEATGMTLDQAFSEYSLWLLLSGDRSDGRHFLFADRLMGVPYAGDYASYPAAEIQTTPLLASFGAAFMRFREDGTEGGLRLNLEGASPGQFQAQVLLTPRKPGAPLVRAVIGVDPRGHGSIGIPWATFSEAVLIVGNVARDPAPAPYSFFARTDRTFPFEVTAFSAEPEAQDVRLTWETRLEDGLFGWIVYRSDSEGTAPRRVNDLIVPAIGEGDGPVSYQYLDDGVHAGGTYYYSLVGVTNEGLTREVPKTRVDLPR